MIDVHCHLEYMKNIDEVVKEAMQKMLAIITSVADPEDFDKIMKIQNKYPDFVFVSAGFHPERMDKYTDDAIDAYLDLIQKNNEKLVAIGEIGLDYSWVKDEKKQERSKRIFMKFIKLAKELKKPLVIHSRNGERNAITEVLDILEKEKAKHVVMHCFSGSNTELKRALELGYYISFATLVCRSDKHKRLAEATPIEKMLLETDAPWLDPFSKELVNRPWNIKESAKVLAGIKNVPEEKIIEKTNENARKIFSLKA